MKKHIKELIFWLLVPIGIVLAILLLVYIFEIQNIHVPGSREMWIGLIGSVIGGAFTMLGVLLTLYKQEETDAEKMRLNNMPILAFCTYYTDIEPEIMLTVLKDELCTSGFLPITSKNYVVFKVSTVNHNHIFNFTVEGCTINGTLIPTGDSFSPSKKRIVTGEYSTLAFGIDNITSNIFCVLRFSYEDIFGNKYYQDLPFTYNETKDENMNKQKQIIEIRDIQSPILVGPKVKSVEDSTRECIDYDVFSGKSY